MSALYIDTSALVLLYIRDERSEAVEAAIDASELLFSSALAFVEVRAALAGRLRNRNLTRNQHLQVVQLFEQDWEEMFSVAATEPVILSAAELAYQHGLRGYDAVHLASALAIQQAYLPRFLTFDQRLEQAAVEEGFTLP